MFGRSARIRRMAVITAATMSTTDEAHRGAGAGPRPDPFVQSAGLILS
jgi:hypothetical protein